jgi:carboxylesterase type B
MMQSGTCFSRPLQEAERVSSGLPAEARCTEPATVLSCLRSKPAGALLDIPLGLPGIFSLTSGTGALPIPPQSAVAAGSFARVPIVIGANRDEGRTIFQNLGSLSRFGYLAVVEDNFRDQAPAILARYPWPETPDDHTGKYLVGAIWNDAGLIPGIGSCASQDLARTFAKYAPTYAYEFAARNGPGLGVGPFDVGYVWGAGHAAELAYLFPDLAYVLSGKVTPTPIAPLFDAGERQLARNMVQYWAAFAFRGRPDAQGQAAWPRYMASGRILSLRPAGASRAITTVAYRGDHFCDFWASLR